LDQEKQIVAFDQSLSFYLLTKQEITTVLIKKRRPRMFVKPLVRTVWQTGLRRAFAVPSGSVPDVWAKPPARYISVSPSMQEFPP
jgi:hypothetical protein